MILEMRRNMKNQNIQSLLKRKQNGQKGYQLWETVSEGSPISPVFKTFKELCVWLGNNPRGITKEMTKKDWVKALKNACPLIDMKTNKLICSKN